MAFQWDLKLCSSGRRAPGRCTAEAVSPITSLQSTQCACSMLNFKTCSPRALFLVSPDQKGTPPCSQQCTYKPRGRPGHSFCPHLQSPSPAGCPWNLMVLTLLPRCPGGHFSPQNGGAAPRRLSAFLCVRPTQIHILLLIDPLKMHICS